MPPKKKQTLEQLQAVLPALKAKYDHRENVTACDVGRIWIGDQVTNDIGLRIHVRRKIELSELEASEVFPNEFQGYPLDIIEGPYRPSREAGFSDPKDRFPVLVGGISCGRPGEGTGTLGAFVVEERTGRVCILSNWHVLAGHAARIGDPIIQPGAVDGGRLPSDVVATLGDSILSADGDAAIAPLTDARPWMPTFLGDTRTLNGQRDPKIGEVLRKSGRSTRNTEAVVDGIGTYFLNYDGQRVGVDGFKLVPVSLGEQDREISAGGDSGSLWYDPDSDLAVGLHFAGETDSNPAAEHALACRMTRVADRLGIRMAGITDLMEAVGSMGLEEPMENTDLDHASILADPRFSPQSDPFPQPWPRPNPWPPVVGPWPWPGPTPWPGPFPGPIPQPWPNEARGAFPRGGGFGGRPVTREAVTEVRPRVSLEGFLVPNLRRALVAAGYSEAATMPLPTKVAVFFPLNHGAGLAEAINDWGPFAQHLRLLASDFDSAVTYVHVLGSLITEYDRAGFEVTE